MAAPTVRLPFGVGKPSLPAYPTPMEKGRVGARGDSPENLGGWSAVTPTRLGREHRKHPIRVRGDSLLLMRGHRAAGQTTALRGDTLLIRLLLCGRMSGGVQDLPLNPRLSVW